MGLSEQDCEMMGTEMNEYIKAYKDNTNGENLKIIYTKCEMCNTENSECIKFKRNDKDYYICSLCVISIIHKIFYSITNKKIEGLDKPLF